MLTFASRCESQGSDCCKGDRREEARPLRSAEQPRLYLPDAQRLDAGKLLIKAKHSFITIGPRRGPVSDLRYVRLALLQGKDGYSMGKYQNLKGCN